jgi:hypothetical protein
VSFGEFDIAEDQTGAHTFSIGAEGFAQQLAGRIMIGLVEFTLRQLTIKLGDFMLEGMGIVAQFQGGRNRFLPIAILLVDVQQLLTRHQSHIAIQELEQNFFGAIHQPGLAKIARQFKTDAVTMFAREIGRFKQLLMQTDGAVVLATRASEDCCCRATSASAWAAISVLSSTNASRPRKNPTGTCLACFSTVRMSTRAASQPREKNAGKSNSHQRSSSKQLPFRARNKRGD